MEIKNYLEKVCKQIKYQPARQDISEELEMHLQEAKEAYILKGYTESEAEEKAVEQMGKAEEIGKKLNKIHKPQLDWKLLILVVILIGFGFLVALARGFETIYDKQSISEFVERTLSATFGAYLFTLTIGGLCGALIYLTDYRKILKYSIHLYVFGTILNIVAYIFGGRVGGNILWGLPILTVSPIVITIPLYVISFVGFINKIVDKKQLTKTIILSIFSLITLIVINFESALVVAITYAIISTIQVLKLKQNRIKNILKIWVFPIILVTLFIFAMLITTNMRHDGYISDYFIKETKIINEAKLFGKIESVDINQTYFVKNTGFAVISLLGNYGWIVSISMVLFVILLNIKLMLNSKKIKDRYGKNLIIGISIIFILETLFNLVMNFLGIPAELSIPLVSYGKVSLIINILCLSLVLSVYRRKNINNYNKENMSELSMEK